MHFDCYNSPKSGNTLSSSTEPSMSSQAQSLYTVDHQNVRLDILFITLTILTDDVLKMFSQLESAVNLPRDSCRISHHTYNVSLHYLVKHDIKIQQNSQNSNVSTNTVSPFCLIVDKINQINLIVCVLLS